MQPTPAPQPGPAPVPQPAPPMPAPQYVPPVQPPAPDPGQYGGGGILKELNWVETGFLILGAFCLFHVVDYYRRKAKQDKADQATLVEVAERVDKVEMNFDGLMRRLTRRR